ncbi:hypothetical protein SLEP1_g8461 [Rubroshorea leprosula]|uniref:Uncharacterized protein n=1 Tax=Rubroshorea leprosula TaxID=152421 RepID=A0AAV5IAU1_9ROSI|nr:hypothetical protein SLEP1_g8461 [Rubroshorea leprosula]
MEQLKQSAIVIESLRRIRGRAIEEEFVSYDLKEWSKCAVLVRVSILVVTSFAAFTVSWVAKKKGTSILPHSENCSSFEQGYGEEERFRDDIHEVEMPEEEIKGVKWMKMRDDVEQNLPGKGDCGRLESMEIEKLQNMVKELEKRKATLERKVLELYGLKEQQSYHVHLHKNLQDKNAETIKLNITINALKVEIKDLQEKSRQGSLTKKNALVEKKLSTVQSIELNVVSLRRRSKALELEKRELAIKLVAAHAKTSAISKLTEGEIIARTEEEITMLRHGNEDLLKGVERLQKNRFSCSMVTSDPSTSSKKNISTESPLMLSPAYVARLGRVSFNDTIVTVPSANIDKGALDEKEMCSDRSIYRSTMSAQCQVEMPERNLNYHHRRF